MYWESNVQCREQSQYITIIVIAALKQTYCGDYFVMCKYVTCDYFVHSENQDNIVSHYISRKKERKKKQQQLIETKPGENMMSFKYLGQIIILLSFLSFCT